MIRQFKMFLLLCHANTFIFSAQIVLVSLLYCGVVAAWLGSRGYVE